MQDPTTNPQFEMIIDGVRIDPRDHQAATAYVESMQGVVAFIDDNFSEAAAEAATRKFAEAATILGIDEIENGPLFCEDEGDKGDPNDWAWTEPEDEGAPAPGEAGEEFLRQLMSALGEDEDDAPEGTDRPEGVCGGPFTPTPHDEAVGRIYQKLEIVNLFSRATEAVGRSNRSMTAMRDILDTAADEARMLFGSAEVTDEDCGDASA